MGMDYVLPRYCEAIHMALLKDFARLYIVLNTFMCVLIPHCRSSTASSMSDQMSMVKWATWRRMEPSTIVHSLSAAGLIAMVHPPPFPLVLSSLPLY